MKSIKYIIFSLSLFILLPGLLKAQGYEYKFHIKGLQDSAIYLANYYGNKLYYADTAVVMDGKFVFKGKEPLPGGLYGLATDKLIFELIIAENEFSIETDTLNYVGNMKITGSEENQKFYEYIKLINNLRKKRDPLQNQYQTATGKEKEKIKKQMKALDNEVKEYQQNILNNNGDMLYAKLIGMSIEPEVPEAPADADSTFAYKWYRAHFWDNVDFSDERLVRSPVFHNKVEKYMKKMHLQQPDSVIKAADELIEKARDNKEMFKYIVHYVTYQYETSKIMGMDAVFVHMAKNYYAPGHAFWMDSAKVANIKERAEELEPLLIGKQAPQLILLDTSETKWVSLYDIPAEYTVLLFWDPDCGHCKKEMPKFLSLYEKFKPRGLEIYSIGTPLETKKWKKHVKDKGYKWINVSDNPEVNKNAIKYLQEGKTTVGSLNFRQTYDIFSTPKVFLLDKNKKIIAKQLSAEQLEEYLERMLGKAKQ